MQIIEYNPSVMAAEKLIEYRSNTLNYNLVSDLLTQLWTQLEQRNVAITNIKKVYSVATECLENIYKHSDFIEQDSECVCFSLQWTASTVQIIAKNPIFTDKHEALVAKVDFIKSLNQIGLKKLYQYEIKKRSLSSVGGAGLGLIIIARKCENMIEFSSKKVSAQHQSVTFELTIPLD